MNCLYLFASGLITVVLNRKWEVQQRAGGQAPPTLGGAVHTSSSSVPAEHPGGSGTKTCICAGSRFLWFQLSDSTLGPQGWQARPTGSPVHPSSHLKATSLQEREQSRGALCAHRHLHEASCRSKQRDPEGWQAMSPGDCPVHLTKTWAKDASAEGDSRVAGPRTQSSFPGLVESDQTWFQMWRRRSEISNLT